MDYQPNPLPRSTITLAQRYDATPSLTAAANAKLAGQPDLFRTDVISTGDGEFRPLQFPAGIANDNRSVQVFTWQQHGGRGFLQTVKYAMSGRL